MDDPDNFDKKYAAVEERLAILESRNMKLDRQSEIIVTISRAMPIFMNPLSTELIICIVKM